MYKLFILLSFVLISNQAIFAQELSKDKAIMLITDIVDDDIVLRWAPTNYDLWTKGNTYGYTIVRSVSIDGELNEDTLVTGLKPLPAEEWESQFGSNNAAQSAKMMLYDYSDPDNVSTLSEALDAKEQRDGKYIFALIAAENDFEVARAMALGYKDENVDTSKLYTYEVFISDEDAMNGVKHSKSIVEKVQEFAQVNTLSVSAEPGIMMLTWEINDEFKEYSGWNIERSVDSITFEKVNPQPFTHTYTDDKFENLISYQDIIDDCDEQYYYRIYGISPFGKTGPVSNCVKVECPKHIMQIPLEINGSVIDDGTITINWRTFDPIYEDSIVGFNIYRTEDMNKPRIMINNELLAPREREYIDKDTITSAYYFLEAIDLMGYPHRSNEHFVQVYDSIPPDPPSGLKAEFVDEQTLLVKWDKLAEKDVSGYHVYLSNTRNGTFIKENKNLLKNNEFQFHFHEKIETDSVFIKVGAEDFFFNSSEYSEVLAIKRPDVWAPSNPVLEYAYPTPKGVALAWQYSADDDVKTHKVQRRFKTDYTWYDVLIISKENEEQYGKKVEVPGYSSNANFIDDYELESRPYYYRIVAMDDSGNEAVSEKVEVVPFLIKKDVTIKDFEIFPISKTIPPQGKLLEELEKLNSPKLAEQIAALTKTVKGFSLSWTSSLTDKLQGFVIYRSTYQSGFKPLITLSLYQAMGLEEGEIVIDGDEGQQEYGFVDTNLKKGRRYSYYVVGKYRNGSETKRSRVVTKKLTF